MSEMQEISKLGLFYFVWEFFDLKFRNRFELEIRVSSLFLDNSMSQCELKNCYGTLNSIVDASVMELDSQKEKGNICYRNSI